MTEDAQPQAVRSGEAQAPPLLLAISSRAQSKAAELGCSRSSIKWMCQT